MVGNFNAESVHFVELDPRVLESLDADIDFTDHSQYRNSSSSYGTDPIDRHVRDSYSSSDQHQLPPQSNWISKPSFESIGTNSSISISNLQSSYLSNQSYTYSAEENIGNYIKTDPFYMMLIIKQMKVEY